MGGGCGWGKRLGLCEWGLWVGVVGCGRGKGLWEWGYW